MLDESRALIVAASRLFASRFSRDRGASRGETWTCGPCHLRGKPLQMWRDLQVLGLNQVAAGITSTAWGPRIGRRLQGLREAEPETMRFTHLLR